MVRLRPAIRRRTRVGEEMAAGLGVGVEPQASETARVHCVAHHVPRCGAWLRVGTAQCCSHFPSACTGVSMRGE